MSRAPPAPAKSILIQVYRIADLVEEETCNEIEARSRRRSTPMPDPPQTNGWFIISDTASGPEISEIFRNLPQEKPIHSREGTNCVLVGSNLYDIGGKGSNDATRHQFSNQIRILDIENLNAGWKSEELPFNSAHAVTAVSGNFIYLIAGSKSESEWGCCVYDTIKQKAYKIEYPKYCGQFFKPTFCVPLSNGVLVPLTEYSEEGIEFYRHYTDKMEWKRLKDVKLPFSKLRYKPHVTSNGVFYVLDVLMGTSVLYAYEIGSWKFHGPIPLPKFKNFHVDVDDDGIDSNVFMVPVSDSELCFLWHREIVEDEYEEEDEYDLFRLCYAKVSISLDPLVAILLKEVEFKIDAIEVLNCLPYDSSADQNREDSLRKSETKVEKKASNKQKKKEQEDGVDWKERCVYLEKENRRLMQELEAMQKQDHITESPEKRKFKRPYSKLLV